LVFSDTSTLMAAISDAVVSIISDLRASSDWFEGQVETLMSRIDSNGDWEVDL
jgi:hypothetical protein